DLTVDYVLQSPYIAYPIHYLDMCPTSDGACAVIMAGEKRARDLCSKPAWIKAAVCRHNYAWIGDVISNEKTTLESAAIEAYRIAGITDPLKELDVIELYDPASYTLVAWLEYMQLCGPGEGRRLVEEGVTAM